MLQIDHEQLNQPIFQKQYSALYYNPSPQSHKKTVIFRYPCEHYTLPVYFLDIMREEEALYLLKWEELDQSKVLYLKKATDTLWISVAMNHYPAHLAITDEHLFLFGSKELLIVGLYSETVKTTSLQDGKIVDLKLCFTESSQPGVSVAYFSTKLGYFTKEYSKSSEDSFWSKLKTIFRLGAKDKKQFELFQVLLPNLVGIALQGESLVLYDLHKMTVTNLSALLAQKNYGKYPPICLRFAKSSKNLSEAMNIYILVKNKILLYIFHVARLQAKEGQPPIPQVSLNSIARGSIIDWTGSIFEKAQFEVTSDFTITDFIVSKEHLIFRQLRQGISEIPTITQVALANQTVQKSIIPQESGIWRHYYTDHSDSQKFVSKFRMEINPEKQLIKQTDLGKKILKIESDCIYYLNQWRHYNKFQGFLLYHGQIYIVRAHSIAVLEDISPLQYELQCYSEEDRLRDEELKIGNQPSHHKNRMRLLQKEAIEKEYRNILFEIKRSAELLHNSNNNIKENDGLPNKSSLLFNTLRDRLDFARDVIDYCENQLKIEEKSYKNKQIIRIVRYLSSSLQNKKQYQVLGSFFIAIFIQRHEHLLSTFNEINIIKILKKLLKNLLPDSFIAQSPTSSAFTNYYLQFLMGYLLSKQAQSTALLAQSELKTIISFVYPSFQDKNQQYLFKSISFVKAYFLSHPDETQFFTYCQHLVKQTGYKHILQGLKQIFHLVPNQLDILIKAELSLKKNQLSFKIFTSKISHLPVSANLQRDYTNLAKQIQSSVCKNESAEYQYQQCHRTIKQILEDITASNYLTFGDIQPKLAQLYRDRIGIDAINEDYAQILQVQQAILICYTNLLNRELLKINDVDQNFSAFQQFLSKLLDQIQLSFLNFGKFHRKLYNFNQKEGHFNMNMLGITQRVNEEESLMSGGYMEETLNVQNNYLSQIFIFLLKKVVSDDNLLRVLAKKSFKWTNNDFVEELLKVVMEEKDITSQEIDILYFYLIKKGEKYMRRIFSKSSRESCSKVVKYLQRMSEKDILYVIASEIEEEFSCFAKEMEGSKSDIKI